MNIADALNKTADHIERHPDQYAFNQGMVLGDYDRGGSACMLARLGQMAGVHRGWDCDTVARGILGISANDFYHRMLEEAGRPGYTPALHEGPMMAPALRKYATKYHGIPEEVREIFGPPPGHYANELIPRRRVEAVSLG